jgi:hypothetical protein
MDDVYFEFSANTFQEFDQRIRSKINDLKGTEPSAEVECVTEIFLRYISLRTALFEVRINLMSDDVRVSSFRIIDRKNSVMRKLI